MLLDFVKMNGAGNDFALIDNRARNIRLTREQVAQLCHRQKGIGADGLIFLIPCASGQADWAWEFYNRDGSVAEMCGNGARCFARFIQRLTATGGPITFETIAGVIRAHLAGERVTIELTEPTGLRLDQQVNVSTGTLSVHCLNTGVPHAVIFVPDADTAMVQRLGAEVRHHQQFSPKGTNVNFVQALGPNSIRVRTYERGVEGETLACGTGVTASALVSSQVHHFNSPVKVQVQSGDVLEVSFRESNGVFRDVKLNGPADFVFEGRIAV
ncbi:MAG: diaminopimelate epimerase [Verrucomicrobia bacterium]|nr:diaminopimelate epimerase [Verrucomicrobiota bacterium]